MNKDAVRKSVADRDGKYCLFCGTRTNLHLHRVTYGSQGGAYEVGNCVILCLKHHDIVHSSKKRWMGALEWYLLQREQFDFQTARRCLLDYAKKFLNDLPELPTQLLE